MDDEQLKRHVLAKRLLRRAGAILRGLAHEENLTPRHRATDLLDAIDLFFASEPTADAWQASENAERRTEMALRMLTFSPDGLPETWPSPDVVAAALAPKMKP